MANSKELCVSFARFLDNAQRHQWAKNAIKYSAMCVYHWEVAGLKMTKAYYVTMKLGKVTSVRAAHSSWKYEKVMREAITLDRKPEVGQYLSREIEKKFHVWKEQHAMQVAFA